VQQERKAQCRGQRTAVPHGRQIWRLRAPKSTKGDLREGLRRATGCRSYSRVVLERRLFAGCWLVAALFLCSACASLSLAPSPGAPAEPSKAEPPAQRRAGWIRGRVVTLDGAPVQSFMLDGERIQSPTGTFEVPFFATGTERLVVGAAGLAPTAKQVEVRAGSDSSVTVVLSPGHVLRGRVVAGTTHQGVPNALVDVTEKPVEGHGEAELSEDWGAVRTGPNGAFELPHVEEGAPTLVVEHEQFEQGWFALGADQTEIVVELSDGATLRGAVRGTLPTCAEAVLVRADGEVTRHGLVQAGTYKLVGIPPGSYVFTVWDCSIPEPLHPLWDPSPVAIPPQGTVVHDVP
jgi:hypothetical protein